MKAPQTWAAPARWSSRRSVPGAPVPGPDRDRSWAERHL